jgi:hypothetical protein
MLDSGKSIVDVAHVPMQVLHALVAANMLEKRLQHLELKIVVLARDLIQRDSFQLCDLMD